MDEAIERKPSESSNAQLLSLVVGGGAVAALAIVLHRGSKVVRFALRSALRSTPNPSSNRAALIEKLKGSLEWWRYLIVQGRSGVGVSHMIDTVLSSRPGVCKVSVDYSMATDEIMDAVQRKMTSTSISKHPLPFDLRRFLPWYRFLPFLLHVTCEVTCFAIECQAMTGKRIKNYQQVLCFK